MNKTLITLYKTFNQIKEIKPHFGFSALCSILFGFASLAIAIQRTNNSDVIQMIIEVCVYSCAMISILSFVWSSCLLIKESHIKDIYSDMMTKSHITIRLIQDRDYRTIVGAYLSLAINLVFAVIRSWMGLSMNSSWFGMLSGYYIVICVIRFILIRSYHNKFQFKNDNDTIRHEIKIYQITGIMLVIMALFLVSAVIHIVFYDYGYVYDGLTIYAVAAYDFWCLMSSIIYMIRVYKKTNPIIKSIKIVSFSTSLVSILSLQTAMFSSFGSQTELFFQRIMNSLTGIIVCLGLIVLGVIMFYSGRKELNKKKGNDND